MIGEIKLGSGYYNTANDTIDGILILPEGITRASFQHLHKLKGIVLPKSLISITSFWGTNNVTSIIAKEGGNFKTVDGNLYDAQMKTLVKYCGTSTSFTIPNSVTTISNSAFMSNTTIKTVNLPSNLERIESSAFESCSGITSLTLPNTLKFIGAWSLSYCGLSDIYIPDSVEFIGVGSLTGFKGASIYIPTSVKQITSSITSGRYEGITDKTNVVIYCAAPSKPAGWDDNWNCARTTNINTRNKVVWNSKR